MSFFGMFKKKKEDDFSDFSNFNSDINLDSGLELDNLNSSKSNMEFDFEEPKQTTSSVKDKFAMSEFNAFNNASNSSKELKTDKTDELILAKLDTLKSEMTNINHRLDKIEEGLKRRW